MNNNCETSNEKNLLAHESDMKMLFVGVGEEKPTKRNKMMKKVKPQFQTHNPEKGEIIR